MDKEYAEAFDEWIENQDVETTMTAKRHIRKLASHKHISERSAKSFYCQFVLFLDSEGALR